MADLSPPRSSPDASPEPPDSLSDRELALHSGRVLDLSSRSARLLALVGVLAIVVIVVVSLTGGRPETIQVDKFLHFGGYATLAAVLVLGLRLRWQIPALIGLVALGVLIEVLQPLNLRTFDPDDALANTLGVATGALLGFGIRLAYGYLRTELEAARVRQNLLMFPPGATILTAGAPVDAFYVIKRGNVALYSMQDGMRVEVARLGPGELVGVLGEVLAIPQPVTAVALTRTQVYRLDYDDVIDAVGGREQPVGVVVEVLASELRAAWQTIAALQRPARPEGPLTVAPASTRRRGPWVASERRQAGSQEEDGAGLGRQ